MRLSIVPDTRFAPAYDFSRLLAAAALLSAFFSAEVCLAFGSQLPFAPAVVPGTRLNPGQHAGPSPVLFCDDFFAVFCVDFFAAFFVAMFA
jgi:hypothetical protein